MAFSGFSIGNKPLKVKAKVGNELKRPFQTTNEEFTADKSNNMCTRCGGKPISSRPCPALSEKSNICEKEGHFSKMWRNKTQTNSAKQKQNFYCEENISSKHASPGAEMRMLHTKEKMFNMSVNRDYVTKNNCKVKMQVNTVADSTIISSKICTELDKPQLDGEIIHLEAYDGH